MSLPKTKNTPAKPLRGRSNANQSYVRLTLDKGFQISTDIDNGGLKLYADSATTLLDSLQLILLCQVIDSKTAAARPGFF